MRIIIFLLTLSVFSCSGFPVYDYDLPVTEEALNASIARINSQSWSRNLYGVVRSRVVGVDTWDSDTYGLDLRFSIRETVCTKASGRDPSTCGFKSGPFVPTASCRSVVEVSGGLIANITVRCHRSTFSSESMSSEEVRKGKTHFRSLPSLSLGLENSDWHFLDTHKSLWLWLCCQTQLPAEHVIAAQPKDI
uniref:Secreted phosphoprotein 24 n=1 Tax=Geospiza parvula TaxID=87175 RepID=A0A8C3NCH7_GEOPR